MRALQGINRVATKVSNVTSWLAVVAASLLPLVIALDYGGVLDWTQYLTAVACLAIAVLALPEQLVWMSQRHRPRFVFVYLWASWLFFTWLQTIAMPGAFVSVLSPATADAWTQWVVPLLGDTTIADSFAISVAADATGHRAAWMTCLLPLIVAGHFIFRTRARLNFLLSAIAVGSGLFSVLGVMQMALPQWSGLPIAAPTDGAPFATFVNRNNAALLMNFGLAASLGVLSWRLMALTGQQVDDAGFQFDDLLALISEREALVGVFGVISSVVGLLACGSRSGLVAAIFGILLAFGWIRRRRSAVSIPILAAVFVIALAAIVVPANLELATLQRIDLAGAEATDWSKEGRLLHWPEGWWAAIAHFPAGSGLGSYGYAYLPFQQSGIEAWFQHADNLWLELFTEQGIVALLIGAGILALLISSLRRLSESPDPLDAGLQTTGWAMIGIVGFSQFFDFGLLIPANTIVALLLTAAIVSRASMSQWSTVGSQPVLTPQAKVTASPLRRRTATLTPVGVTATSFLLALLALPRLHRDAVAESLIFAADAQIDIAPTEPEPMQDLLGRMEALAESAPSADLFNAMGRVHYQLARLNEVVAANPNNLEEAASFYRATDSPERRLLSPHIAATVPSDFEWLADFSGRFPVSDQLYAPAAAVWRSTLQHRPLDFDARFGLLKTDFVDFDFAQTAVLLRQLETLYENSSGVLFTIGRWAAQSGHNDLAEAAFRRVIERRPLQTNRVWTAIADYPNVSVAKAIPDLPAPSRIVAAKILQRDRGRPTELLPTFLKRLQCDHCDTIREKSDCLALRGEIRFRLGNNRQAFDDYLQAIKLNPGDPELRLTVIRHMQSAGFQPEALMQARLAKEEIPQDERFQQVVETLTERVLPEVERELSGPLP